MAILSAVTTTGSMLVVVVHDEHVRLATLHAPIIQNPPVAAVRDRSVGSPA
jgi:hypothetical protein